MPSLLLVQGKAKPDGSAKAIAHVEGGRHSGATLWLSDAPGRSKVELDSGLMIMEPPHDASQRFITALMAASGSGKSTQIALTAERYHLLYPRRPIVLLSKLDQDDTLDALPYIRRLRADSLLEHDFELGEMGMEGSLVIMDDLEALPKDIDAKVQTMLELILCQGRHFNVSLLYSAHNLTNGLRTRTLLNESHTYVVFPHASSAMQLKYLLSRYAGLDNKEIAQLRHLPSRWTCVGRRYPPYVLCESSAYLPHAT